MVCSLIAPNGDTKQKLEFLGNGQQVVLDGIHPDTRKPYTWRGGVPGDVGLKALPYINEAEAQMLFRDAVELLVAEHGYKIAPSRPKNGNGHHHSDGAKDWSWLMGSILDGAELHDASRDLAAKLVSSGVKGGAAVNIVRATMERSKAPRDARFDERMRDIPRLVSSAEGKFERQEERPPSPNGPINLADVFTFIEDKPASPPKELIKGLVPAEGVAVTGGQSTAGKTFIQIHKAICLATASAYFGHRVVERVGTALAESMTPLPSTYGSQIQRVRSAQQYSDNLSQYSAERKGNTGEHIYNIGVEEF
jgi:hypothetical protein